MLKLEDEDEVTNYDEMCPYNQAKLIEAYDAKLSKVFYTQAQDLAAISKRLNEELKYSFRASYEDKGLQPIPERLKALTIYFGRSRIVIRKIPLIADVLGGFCRHFRVS